MASTSPRKRYFIVFHREDVYGVRRLSGYSRTRTPVSGHHQIRPEIDQSFNGSDQGSASPQPTIKEESPILTIKDEPLPFNFKEESPALKIKEEYLPVRFKEESPAPKICQLGITRVTKTKGSIRVHKGQTEERRRIKRETTTSAEPQPPKHARRRIILLTAEERVNPVMRRWGDFNRAKVDIIRENPGRPGLTWNSIEIYQLLQAKGWQIPFEPARAKPRDLPTLCDIPMKSIEPAD